MNKIKSISIATNLNDNWYSVGRGGVIEITSCLNGTVYQVRGEGGKLIAEIVNCPVEIIYE